MDGVVTDTAAVHAVVWKRLFDSFLETRAQTPGADLRPFDVEEDYRKYVDGKSRYTGAADFLASRGIVLPYGSDQDAPGGETVCGLGNQKNIKFNEWLEQNSVDTFPAAVRLIETLRRAGIKTAVFSASRNAEAVLRSAGALHLFDAKVDGNDLARLGLPSKPNPSILIEAAKRLAAKPEKTAVVEDSVAGIEAATRGGFRLAVGVDRTHQSKALTSAGAHLVICTLGEVMYTPEQGFTLKTISNLPLLANHRDELRSLLSGRSPAVFLDYDGTLTPIIEDYTKATLSEPMRSAIAQLSRLCPVAIISGRDAATVRGFVKIENIYYAGSHGFEITGPSGWEDALEKGKNLLPDLDKADELLRDSLAGIAGHSVERKRYEVAVHYRKVDNADVAQIEREIDKALSKFPQLIKGHGKKVFRLIPNIEWHKGHAVSWILERLDLQHAGILPIYIGDDITDEDAFRTLSGRGLCLTLRDDNTRPTVADYALKDVEEVRRFLDFLTKTLQQRRR